MSNILQIQAKDAVVRINQFDVLNGIQDFDWEPNFNEEFIDELGNEAHAGMRITPDVSGSFNVTSVGATASTLGRMIYELDDVTGEFTGPRGPDNDGLIRELDLQRAVFDLVELKKANEVFDRATLIPRAHLSTLSLSASADGNASESYGFIADVTEVYRRPLHDLIPLPVTRAGSASDSTVEVPAGYTVDADGTDAAAEWIIHQLMIDGNVVLADDLLVIPGDDRGVDTDLIEVSGREVTKGAKLSLIISRKVPGQFPSITYPTSARFISADQIDLWLVSKATMDIEAQLKLGTNLNTLNFANVDLFLRAQTQDFNIDMGLEALREIRKNDLGTPVYARAPTYPLNISSSLSCYETDLNDWAKIQGKNAMGSANPDILNLTDFAGTEFQLVRRDYIKGVPVQTVVLLDARVDGRGSRISVGGRAEVSWGFSGSKIALQGVAGV